MSGGYADRLSVYPDKGVCGLPETFDSSRALTMKVNKLHQLIQTSRSIVVMTGAGISTAAGIADFRGPKGVWTLEKERDKAAAASKKRPREESDGADVKRDEGPNEGPKGKVEGGLFPCTAPTYTHRALAKLMEENIIQRIVTQNVDGLHLRSGVPRACLSILHGDCFVEKCEDCKAEYFRDFDICGLSFQKTGRFCNGDGSITDSCKTGCGGVLRDTILDWDDELPEADFEAAEISCDSADLVIALGTSLRIVPAGTLPLKAKQFAIVNLQKTPHDNEASVLIHHNVDIVMDALLNRLNIHL
jgi:mono-ADP-ribosyltransferase sirtuin 6